MFAFRRLVQDRVPLHFRGTTPRVPGETSTVQAFMEGAPAGAAPPADPELPAPLRGEHLNRTAFPAASKSPPDLAEDRLLGVAAELEATHPWAGRRLPISGAGRTEEAT